MSRTQNRRPRRPIRQRRGTSAKRSIDRMRQPNFLGALEKLRYPGLLGLRCCEAWRSGPRPRLILSRPPRRGARVAPAAERPVRDHSQKSEVDHEQLTACKLPRSMPIGKRAIAKRFPDFLVLGANTVVSLDGMLFGKPNGLAAARMLSFARPAAKLHRSLPDPFAPSRSAFAEITFVTFTLSARIDRYLSSINPLDKAGAAIQERGECWCSTSTGPTQRGRLPWNSARAESWES